jgi:hypothetical protein
MSQRKLPTPEDDFDRQLLDTVARVGWMVLGIEASAEGPAYAFSIVMFHTLGHPEIVLMGLRPPVAQQLINVVGSEIRNGKRFEAGQRYEGITTNFSVAFVAVDPSYYRPYLGYARWFYGGSNFPAVQCVWPDKRGVFPWEPDYDARFFEVQRLLGAVGTWPHGWPFDAPPNQATFTVRAVGQRTEPVLYVVHEADGTWQFLAGGPAVLAEAMLVALEVLLPIDPSLIEIADLPIGWEARRSAVGAPWERTQRPGHATTKNEG